MKKLISTLSKQEYPFNRIEEFADNGESLEVLLPNLDKAKIQPGPTLYRRFRYFMPFSLDPTEFSLGEGNTPLLKASQRLSKLTGIKNLWLKMESQNPTWSFKDRGSLACILMAKEMGERITATISTGNMGNSIAAYAARAGLKSVIFLPDFTPIEKIYAMSIHDPTIVKVKALDYAFMKKSVLGMAKTYGLRIVSGNGPIRVEGYKFTAFELFEQMGGTVPDYIAVPTSACGHIRGIFKGFIELQTAGYIDKLPRMIVVQAHNNSPIVTAIKEGKDEVVPFTNFHTIAEAITTGNPMGGNEIIQKAKVHKWLAESVTEEEIMEGHKELGRNGHFVEPASATTLYAVKKLKEKGLIEEEARVVLMITGAGLKDLSVFTAKDVGKVIETDVDKVGEILWKIDN